MKIGKIIFRNLFLLLLPVFFLLHHFLVNYTAVTPGDIVYLLLIHIAVIICIVTILYFILKSWLRAALISVPVMLFILFFGFFSDSMARIISVPAWARYLMLIIFCLFTCILLLRLLKRSKQMANRLAVFFSVLFLLWILADLLQAAPVFRQFQTSYNAPAFKPSGSREKPAIYLLVLDEYPGSAAAKEIFGFDNSWFEGQLRKKGFRITEHSRSNYDLTSFSIASMLSLDYLPLSGTIVKNHDYSLTAFRINQTALWSFLKEEGYEIRNHSIFTVDDQQPQDNSYRRNYNMEYFYRTLPGRLYQDFPGVFSSEEARNQKKERELYKDRHYNQKRIAEILNSKSAEKPVFLYLHLMMPHYPYYSDSSGKETDAGGLMEKENLIPYLVYTNKTVLAIIEKLQAMPGSKIIYLVSDHGFREGATPGPVYFQNFSAIYSPGEQVSFQDSMTNLNQFRAVLNAALQQTLPMLPDSSISVFR